MSPRELFPWPTEEPWVEVHPTGWFQVEHEIMLRALLSKETRTVVEIGSWKGESTRFIAEVAPNATVYAVDTWLGSWEHHVHPEYRKDLPNLYEEFLAHLWPYKGRVVPVRLDSLNGIILLKKLGVEPDVVFVDGAHDFDSALRDFLMVVRAWPNAVLCGDDYHIPGVKLALRVLMEDAAGKDLGTLLVNGRAWRFARDHSR